jgi:hypothetical protein
MPKSPTVIHFNYYQQSGTITVSVGDSIRVECLDEDVGKATDITCRVGDRLGDRVFNCIKFETIIKVCPKTIVLEAHGVRKRLNHREFVLKLNPRRGWGWSPS